MVIEITDWKRYMNEPESEEYPFITEKYREQLQDKIEPVDFIKALLMAEEYKADGFTLDGFIEELKKAISCSIPDYNISTGEKINKALNDMRLYTDIARDITNQLSK